MARIGVFTSDFKFYRDIIRLLKEWDLPFLSIEVRERIPPDVVVILSSSKDDFVLDSQVKSDTAIQALRMSLSRLLMKDMFENLTIGIDPGPYPGIAVFADNVLMEAFECSVLENLGSEIESIIKSYSYRNIEVKVGNGDIPNRDSIIAALRNLNLKVKMVDEKNTSFPHHLHDNALSAARIAQVQYRYVVSDAPGQNLGKKNVYEREFTTLRSLIS